MKCPECGTWTEVLESVLRKDGSRRRRYQCANMHRFNTEERVVLGRSSTHTEKTAALQKIEATKKRVMKKPPKLEKPWYE